MEHLEQELERLIAALPNANAFRTSLETLVSVYPFNEYEYIIATLLAAAKLTHDEYVELRDAYIARNMFLYIFEISAPRGFGEAWAQGHLKELVPELQKPSKHLDPSYSGEYDFLLDGKIKIEVKASRAVDFDRDEPLYVKALASDSTKRFDMNFQQLKPSCCDVFVWIAVWRNDIYHWVLTSHEVATNRNFSNQHRKEIKGLEVYEGQIHVKHDNIHDFSTYEAKSNELAAAIRNAYERQKQK